MDKPVCKMSEEAIRQELVQIRNDRTGKGRRARTEAKVKRISQAGQDRRVKKNVEAEENADWV